MQAHYFSPVDINGDRQDCSTRPELQKGSVDFLVPPSYWAQEPSLPTQPLFFSVEKRHQTQLRVPRPMRLVFVIDISLDSTRSGFTKAVCMSLLSILYFSRTSPLDSCYNSAETEVAFVGVDNHVHFYDLTVRECPPGLQSRRRWL